MANVHVCPKESSPKFVAIRYEYNDKNKRTISTLRHCGIEFCFAIGVNNPPADNIIAVTTPHPAKLILREVV